MNILSESISYHLILDFTSKWTSKIYIGVQDHYIWVDMTLRRASWRVVESQTPGQAKVPPLSGFAVSSAGMSSQWISDDPKHGISCKVAGGTGNTMCFLVLEVAQGYGAASKSKQPEVGRDLVTLSTEFCFSAEWYNHLSNFNLNSVNTTGNTYWLFFGGSAVKCKFDPLVWKILCRKKWQPPPVFLSGKSHGRRNLVGYSPWDRRESDMT